ncbi:hypothetical protein K1719_004820 [Acacia pycnantha]|nr:hypothetical protein K1719_004820 [Acacia pycnantha]
MFGLYSEKSDVFSFGVIVLEIISGKKNASCHDDSQYADSLLSYTWNQWSSEKLLEMLDSNLKEVESYNEVSRCIQIGLLCVQKHPEARPSMATIVSYLSNDSIELPRPQQPAFFCILEGDILLQLKNIALSMKSQVIGRNDLYPQCSTDNNFTVNSTFDSNLNTLFSSLTSNTTANLDFYNTTVGRGDDTVYGLFMCQGDVNQDVCRQCVGSSTIQLGNTCRFSKDAVNWGEQCLVRYSDLNFFSTVATRPRLRRLNPNNVSNQAGFMDVLRTVMNTTADEAAKPGLMQKKFGTNATTVEFQILYVLVQCTPDLSTADCKRCLSGVIGDFTWCCDGKIGGRVLYPSCLARFELYQFFNSSTPIRPVPLSPPPALFSPPNPGKLNYMLL